MDYSITWETIWNAESQTPDSALPAQHLLFNKILSEHTPTEVWETLVKWGSVSQPWMHNIISGVERYLKNEMLGSPSRDSDAVGQRWGVLESLGEELAPVDGKESGA